MPASVESVMIPRSLDEVAPANTQEMKKARSNSRRRGKILQREVRGEIGVKVEAQENEIVTIVNVLEITVPLNSNSVPSKIQARV